MHHAHRFNRPLAIDLLEDQFKLMVGHVVKCLIIDGRNSRLTFLRAYDAVKDQRGTHAVAHFAFGDQRAFIDRIRRKRELCFHPPCTGGKSEISSSSVSRNSSG